MVPFNLRERIFAFVLEVLDLIKLLPESRINQILINQIGRSATSIGANYEEADGTATKKDFAYKMSLVKKEAKETKYWLKLIRVTNTDKHYMKIDSLGIECEELIRIIATIIIKSTS
ncbi:MAG: four helix bundle protein [Patescibacteria group bacterium]